MPSRKRKSPRKNSGARPDYYGTNGDQDSREITSGKASAKTPSNKRRRTGYKEPLTKRTPRARKNSSESSWESSAYEEESESDDGDKGLVIDISNKKRKMVATGVGRSKHDEDIDEVDTNKTSSQLAITKVRK